MQRVSLVWLTASLALATQPALAAQPTPGDLATGRRLAEENCGMCHAIGAGGSPAPFAPPFRDLFKRYPPAGLDALLREGMLAPTTPQEEGQPTLHPKMPMTYLDIDQVSQLKAYLHSLEPPPAPRHDATLRRP